MSIRTPPTLLQLAGESLLRDQASAIAALEHLPAELFPQLFILAYHSRHYSSLKAMAQAWPYPVLPLGHLMQRPQVKVLKAVLDGLDVLLAQEVCPRKWKLRVLDLRNLGANLWRVWCGDSTLKHSLTIPVTVHRSSPNMEHPLAPLEVFLDLDFNEKDRDEFFMYIIQWAQQREGLLHLCCKTLRIAGVPFQRVRKFLDAVQLDCIQEVELNCTWDLHTLGTFALYLGQMRNLQRLSLSYIHVLSEEEDEDEEEELEEEEEEEEQDWVDDEEQEWGEEEEQEWVEGEEQEWEEEEEEEWEEEEEQEWVEDEEQEWVEGEEQEWEEEEEQESVDDEEQDWEEEEEQDWEEEEEQEWEEGEEWEREEQGSFSQFLSQMRRLQHLRELVMESPSFLRGRLDQMLRYLQTPLERLIITYCRRLTHSDLTHLFQCPNLRQLQSLHLYRASLADFSPEPLRALLEAVAPTLEELYLDSCAMVDSQVEAILPVLSRCHQLIDLTILENRLSMATVGKLVRHTAGLHSLEHELYPVPLECYTTQGTVNQDTLALIQAELTGMLREIGQPRTIQLAVKHGGYSDFYDVAFS